MKQEKDVSIVVFKILVAVILGAYVLVIFGMLGWGFIASLKSDLEFSMVDGGDPIGLPSWEWSKAEILFGNYKLAFKYFSVSANSAYYVGQTLVTHSTKADIWVMLGNTILYVGISTLLPTIASYIVAYLCTTYNFRFSKIVYTCALISMTIPIVSSQGSMITLLRTMGIYDTVFTHIVQKFVFGGSYFFVFCAFFEGLNGAYSEAAEIDGASQFRIFIAIIIPLGAKMISSIALLNFVTYWNDYQSPLLYTPTLPTIAYGVYHLINEAGNAALKNIPASCACCMILALPIVLMFVFLKDKLMGNISMGGVKG